jgi:hypothetical protein
MLPQGGYQYEYKQYDWTSPINIVASRYSVIQRVLVDTISHCNATMVYLYISGAGYGYGKYNLVKELYESI